MWQEKMHHYVLCWPPFQLVGTELFLAHTPWVRKKMGSGLDRTHPSGRVLMQKPIAVNGKALTACNAL